MEPPARFSLRSFRSWEIRSCGLHPMEVLRLLILCLDNSPESLKQLGDTDKFDYTLPKYWFEFYLGQLPGLKTSVDSGNSEVVAINGQSLRIPGHNL